jgi:hypothetical protein
VSSGIYVETLNLNQIYENSIKSLSNNNNILNNENRYSINPIFIIKMIYELFSNCPKTFEYFYQEDLVYNQINENTSIEPFFDDLEYGWKKDIAETKAKIKDFNMGLLKSKRNKNIKSLEDGERKYGEGTYEQKKWNYLNRFHKLFEQKVEKYEEEYISLIGNLVKSNQIIIEQLSMYIQNIYFKNYNRQIFEEDKVHFQFHRILEKFILYIGKIHFEHKLCMSNDNFTVKRIHLIDDSIDINSILNNNFFQVCSMYYEFNSINPNDSLVVTNAA